MQFKNPEILYFLALLIIPIIVHLFQLQKFVKIPFSNVAFLQKIQQQTRKSSRIKKWLILATRMLLFTAIVFAFSQPYFSNKNIDKKQHNFIYLDNSLSTNTKGEKGDLLKVAAQEIIKNSSLKSSYSLLTNSNFHENISSNELKNALLKVEKTTKNLDLESVLLKLNLNNKNKTNTLNKNILISDFQNTYKNEFTNVTQELSLIQLQSSKKNNISIDSVFISNKNNNNFTVNVVINNIGTKQNNVPIALFNKDILVSKQTFPIKENSKKTITFTVKKSLDFSGKTTLTYSDTFGFDNTYYFTLNNNEKTNILSIGNSANFLQKIYTENEFNFFEKSLQNVNYNALKNQQLIILNELKEIPEILKNSLEDFLKNGGNLVIIPNQKTNISSYNLFLKNLKIGSIKNIKKDTLKITSINFKHPIFENVFSKNISNFQYPSVNNHYPITGNISSIISFENNTPFISKFINKNIYFVSSSLDKNSSNFINSPLVVPVFYNIAKASFSYPKLAYNLNEENKIEVKVKASKDEILSITSKKASFIPLQRAYQNKVVINTTEQPQEAGFYQIKKQDSILKELAFNNPKEESSLQFLNLNDLKALKNISTYNSIKDVFTEINKNNEVQWLWKWFLALAIVSLLLEIFILKFYKP
ncbi:BatA domain-containing protein [Polaribacter sp. KT 15]|uniref:BatA domain-containing protein n=1 Tax=Polaribacter sp. KT 15 TaxID=1896175 RepID=UPI00090CBA72|nr:BatA domain-containing protein [Polaribacter sp. KT 15]SHN05469.1 N-terminal double-transmembrane domain-containing protein [Polaribacter sp. KT 15]